MSNKTGKFERKIRFINNTSFKYEDIQHFYKNTVEILGDVAKVINDEEEIVSFIKNPFETVNKLALIIVDDWKSKNKRDWSSFVNKLITSPERVNSHFNIIICTNTFLPKTLLRRNEVELITKLK